MLRCPDPSCSAAVGQDMVNLLASEEDKGKYERYLCRSYIEDNRKVSPYLSEFYLNSNFLSRAPSAAQLVKGGDGHPICLGLNTGRPPSSLYELPEHLPKGFRILYRAILCSGTYSLLCI